MSEKLTHCDKCHTLIKDGVCSCGYWVDGYKNYDDMTKILVKTIFSFNEFGSEIITVDHFTGTCIALFKGNYDDCMKVRSFIEKEILHEE